MLQSPQRLEQIRVRLAEIPHGQLTPTELEALAECCFRIAVHPQTPYEKAVALLSDAMKLDCSNPKYAFHMGRILLQNNEMKSAQKAFEAAYKIVPSNHRIWACFAQMLWQMEHELKGSKGYIANSLGGKADRLVKGILSGEDFVDDENVDCVAKYNIREDQQKPSPRARMQQETADQAEAQAPQEIKKEAFPKIRYTKKGQCRNRGVLQLQLEQILAGSPTGISVKKAREYLDRIVAIKMPNQRRHMFIVSAVQWLIRGYPVAVITGCLQDASLRCALLDALTDVFSKPFPQNVLLLSGYVNAGTVPVYTGSVAHAVLAQHLSTEPKAPFHVCYAKTLTIKNAQDTDTEKILAVNKALCVIYNDLQAAPFCPAVLQQEKKTTSVQGADEIFTELETALPVLENCERMLMKEYARMKAVCADANTDNAQCQQLYTDFQKAKKLLDQLVGKAKYGIDKLETAKCSYGEQTLLDKRDVFEGIKNRLTELQGIGKYKRLSSVIEKKLAGDYRQDGVCAQALNALEQEMQPAFAQATAPSQTAAEQPAVPESAPDTAEKLDATMMPRTLETTRSLVDKIEETVARHYGQSIALLNGYQPAVRGSDAYRQLEYDATFAYAMVLARMNRPMEARELFAGLRRLNAADKATAKNIAVLNTLYTDDISESSVSWEAYIELLYFYPTVTGNMALFAQERYAFHRALALANCPCDIFADIERTAEEKAAMKKKQEDGTYAAQLNTFLESPAQANAFTANFLLMYLNKLFTYKAPFTMLGVTDVDTASVRELAQKNLRQFNQEIKQFYPERLRAMLADSIDRYFVEIYENCAVEAKYGSLNKEQSDAEKMQYVRFATDVIITKLNLLTQYKRLGDAPKGRDSEVCACLAKLNAFPLTEGSEITQIILSQINQTSCELLKGMMNNVCLPQIMEIVNDIFAYHAEPETVKKQNAVYRNAIAVMEAYGVLDTFHAAFDNIPKGVHEPYDAVIRSFSAHNGKSLPPDGIATLENLTRRFPRTYGVFYALFQAYSLGGETQKAAEWLGKTRDAALTAETKQEIEEQIQKYGVQLELVQLNAKINEICNNGDNPKQVAQELDELISETRRKAENAEDEEVKKQYEGFLENMESAKNDAVFSIRLKQIKHNVEYTSREYGGNADRVVPVMKDAISELKALKDFYNHPEEYPNAQVYVANINQFIENLESILKKGGY